MERGLTVVAVGLCDGLGFSFELGVEWFVVEEGPGVIELVVPGPFEIDHRLNHAVHLIISHERQYCSVYSRRVGIISGIVISAP